MAAASAQAQAQAGGSSQRPPESDVDEEFVDDSVSDDVLSIEANAAVPDLFTTPAPVRDALATATSQAQDETVRECVPLLAATDSDIEYNAHGVPSLLRDNHIRFLQKQLGRFPAPYVAADASRPWFLYWSLNALALLGYDTAVYREGLIKTVRTMQNPSGGIGGGHGQNSHLATTYAVVLALAIVGGEDAYEAIDRKSMWRWLCSLKQPSGGIQMTLGGEVDVRGAYCAAVIVTLLNLPLDLSTDSPAWTPERPTLFTGLADYVRRCKSCFSPGCLIPRPHARAHPIKARRSRVEYRESRMVKRMERMRSARWAASPSWTLRTASSQNTLTFHGLSLGSRRGSTLQRAASAAAQTSSSTAATATGLAGVGR